MNILSFDNPESMTEHGAVLFLDVVNAAMSARGAAYVALSGGRTPKALYQRLAQPPYFGEIPWEHVHLYFGDERVVGSDNPRSNFRMVKEALLDRVPIPVENVHRVPTEMGPKDSAFSYDAELHGLAVAQDEMVPRFDLVLLGLGPDGHTASLFPGTAALEESSRFATVVHLPPESIGAKDAAYRVTVTYPVINAARQILFLVAGNDKANALGRIEGGDTDLPAARVRPENGHVRWLIVKPDERDPSKPLA